MVCIYHSRDLDGFASGAIVKHQFPSCKLIGYDYGEPLPFDEIEKGEDVIIIDVSAPMPEMEKLAEHSGWKMVWIDHHISAINEFNKYTEGKEDFCRTKLRNGVSACELGWEFCFPNEPTPTAITLLGEYDTWRNGDAVRWEREILPFQYGMRNMCTSPESFPAELFSASAKGLLQDIVQAGHIIISYEKAQNELRCKSGAFETTFMGYSAICLNIPGGNSQVFESVYDENKHDLMMPFYFDGKKWVYSLYTTKEDVDCSAIAKASGGGGHKKAAGFQSQEILPNFKSQIEGKI